MCERSRGYQWFSLAGLVIVLDQLTKYFANSMLDYGQPLSVLPSFNLTLLYNRGAAFSFLNDAGGWQRWFFTAIAVVAIVFIVVWIRKLGKHETLLAFALALILGGAAGNLIDRVLFGYVIDFIQVFYSEYFFPAFNIADSAISVGAVFLIWSNLKAPKNSGAA
ncbi:MAG: signal peptidase II [Gammaproteobacteria bacterium]